MCEAKHRRPHGYLFAFLLYCYLYRYIDGIGVEFMDSFGKTSVLRVKVAGMPKVKEMYTGVAGFEA